MSQTSGVSEEKATCKFVLTAVVEFTDVAEIVIGEDGEVVEV